MKKKNSGFTASGLSRPEIRPGDIFRDTRRGDGWLFVTLRQAISPTAVRLTNMTA